MSSLKRLFKKENIKDFLIMNLGAIMVALAFVVFKEPNHYTMGGIAGLSLIIQHFVPNLPAGAFVTILNGIILIIGLMVLGKRMGIETIYCSILYSIVIWAGEEVMSKIGYTAPITGDMFVDLCFGVIIGSIGSALLYNVAATTGGTDILTMILKKYTNMNISVCIFLSDVVICIGGGFVYGWKVACFALLGLIIQVSVVKVVIENMNLKKEIAVITEEPKKIVDYINNVLHRGATCVDATGAFTGKNKAMVFSVLSNSQALQLKKAAKSIDESAFIIITNTTDIIGKGFRQSVLDFADSKKHKYSYYNGKAIKEKPIEPPDEYSPIVEEKENYKDLL